jgi:hypothetical protein
MYPFYGLAEGEAPSWWEQIFFNALSAFWTWLIATVDTVFDEFLTFLLAAVPSDYATNATAFRHYAEVANCWVALDYGLTMLGVFYTFLSVFVVLKFVLKLIPTVG